MDNTYAFKAIKIISGFLFFYIHLTFTCLIKALLDIQRGWFLDPLLK